MVVYESFFACTFFLGSKRSKQITCAKEQPAWRQQIYVWCASPHQTARGNQQHTPNSILSVSQYSILCGFIYLHENRHQALRAIDQESENRGKHKGRTQKPSKSLPSKYKARIKCHKPNDHRFYFSFSFCTFSDIVFWFLLVLFIVVFVSIELKRMMIQLPL